MRTGSADRSAPVYDGWPAGEVVDWPVSRGSKRITNLPADAMRWQNSGSHQSIDEVAPPISRTAGSACSPNVSTQSSASPTGIIERTMPHEYQPAQTSRRWPLQMGLWSSDAR